MSHVSSTKLLHSTIWFCSMLLSSLVLGCEFYCGCCLSRLVGVGEASFISLAAPFIDDNAPAAQVSFCFFVFSLVM